VLRPVLKVSLILNRLFFGAEPPLGGVVSFPLVIGIAELAVPCSAGFVFIRRHTITDLS
jgi:hypothetical protein